MKRFLAIIMTLCLVLGLSSVSVWADEATWQNEATLPNPSYYSVACTVGDKIYVIGGLSPDGAILQSVQIYDTKEKNWTTGKAMSVKKSGFTASVVGAKIYVIGGTVSSSAVNTVEIYDTQTDTWTSGPSMSDRRLYCTAAVFNNQIYVIGGHNGSAYLDSMEIYDPKTNIWTTGSSLLSLTMSLSSAVVGNKIYAIGGNTGTYTNRVEIYDLSKKVWVEGPSLISIRGLLSSVAIGNKIYAIGGYGGPGMSTIETLGVSDTNAIALSVLLNEGETVQLSTSYNLANNSNFTWSSTNEAVATVDTNGKVTAVAVGEADIYAQSADGTFKEYVPVKVVEAADELRLAVHLKAGEKAKLYLTDDSSQVTWSSMDESIATISADGQVTGIKKGLAIVQAVLDGQTYQIYVRVNG